MEVHKGLWTLSFLPSKWDYWENNSFISAQDFVKVVLNGKTLPRNNKKKNLVPFLLMFPQGSASQPAGSL